MDKEFLTKIKILREKTGAPIGKCKEALEKSNGDLEKAEIYLREKGESLLEKKKETKTTQGIITSYTHYNGKVASLVELKCETDFVAKNEEFKKLAYEIAIQVAALKPIYLSTEEIPQEVIEKKKREFLQGMENKPEKAREEIFEGKFKNWIREVCLLEQPYIKNENLTIKDLISEYVNKFGEKIEVGRFVRLALNE